MFQTGDYVIYGNSGVCQVEKVEPLGGRGPERRRMYYTLKPKYSTETIYVPVDTGTFMRRIISREEAEALIDRIPFVQPNVCSESNSRVLTDHYKTTLKSHDCEKLLQTIKAVYLKGKRAAEQKRKPGQVDQHFGKLAEELFHGELAVALDMPVEEVKGYIRCRVQAMQSDAELAQE